MRRWLFRIHKWMGIGMGAVLAMWLVTGIVVGTGRRRPVPRVTVDYAAAAIAPAQALAAAGVTSADSVALVRLADIPVYRVFLRDRGVVLVDARSGSVLQVDRTLARAIAQATYDAVPGDSIQAPAVAGKGWFVLGYGDRAGTLTRVSARDGSVEVSDRVQRVRQFLRSLHTLGALRKVSFSNRGVERAVILTCLLGLVSVVTGYVMALPRRRSRST